MLKAAPLLRLVMAAIAVVGLACSSAPEPTGTIALASQPLAPASQPPTPGQLTPSTPATTTGEPTVAVAPVPAPQPEQPTATNMPTAAVTPAPTPQPAPPAPAASSAPVGTRVGERVPAFTVTTLDGVRLTNADFQGKPYLLFYFATW